MAKFGVMAAASVMVLAAGGAQAGPFARAFAGVSMDPEYDVDTFTSAFVGFDDPVFVSSEIDLDTGFAIGGSAGYKFDVLPIVTIIPEGEVGYRRYGVGRQRTVFNFPGDTPNDVVFSDTDDDADLFTFGGNLRFRVDFPLSFFGYLGGGGGALMPSDFGALDSQVGHYYQGLIGGGYEITESLDVTLEYRYIDGRFSVDGDPDRDLDYRAQDVLFGVSFNF